MVTCLFCRREVEMDLSVPLDIEGQIVSCCDECFVRGEEAEDRPEDLEAVPA